MGSALLAETPRSLAAVRGQGGAQQGLLEAAAASATNSAEKAALSRSEAC